MTDPKTPMPGLIHTDSGSAVTYDEIITVVGTETARLLEFLTNGVTTWAAAPTEDKPNAWLFAGALEAMRFIHDDLGPVIQQLCVVDAQQATIDEEVEALGITIPDTAEALLS